MKTKNGNAVYTANLIILGILNFNPEWALFTGGIGQGLQKKKVRGRLKMIIDKLILLN